MNGFPPGYHVDGTTWMYLSAILIVAVFFRFSRVWSLRNLDLALLLGAAPGLALADTPGWQDFGFIWLFGTSGLFVVRLLLDPILRRRPVLGQNLNPGGMWFLSIASLVLLTHAAMRVELPSSTTAAVEQAQQLIDGETSADATSQLNHGPAAPIMMAVPGALYGARAIAVLAHVAVALGLYFVGRNLYSYGHLGLAMATLYLLHPATAYDVGAATHVLPAALIVWAFVAYRRPVISGILLGLACGTLFFPLFLLPIWLAFYGRRGGLRFTTSLIAMTAVLSASMLWMTSDPDSFVRKTVGTIHLNVMHFEGSPSFTGFWSGDGNGWFRVPVIATYLVMLVALTVWPRQKNLEHLMTFSAVAIVGTQFWYPQEGGVYVLWYLPLVLMVIFRPRLVHLTPPAPLDPEAQALAPTPSTAGLTRPPSTSTLIGRARLFR
jgi:hypothetical protein